MKQLFTGPTTIRPGQPAERRRGVAIRVSDDVGARLLPEHTLTSCPDTGTRLYADFLDPTQRFADDCIDWQYEIRHGSLGGIRSVAFPDKLWRVIRASKSWF